MTMKLDHDDLDRLIDKISSSDIQEFFLLSDLSHHDLIS